MATSFIIVLCVKEWLGKNVLSQLEKLIVGDYRQQYLEAIVSKMTGGGVVGELIV